MYYTIMIRCVGQCVLCSQNHEALTRFGKSRHNHKHHSSTVAAAFKEDICEPSQAPFFRRHGAGHLSQVHALWMTSCWRMRPTWK